MAEAGVEVVVEVALHFLWRSEVGSGVWVISAFSRLNSSSILFAFKDLLGARPEMRTRKRKGLIRTKSLGYWYLWALWVNL